MASIVITYDEFPTHAPKTNNKKAPNKYIKINGQSIYNSNLNRFARNNVMRFMHDYLISGLPRKLGMTFPIEIELIFYAPINYGTVRRFKGEIRWIPPKSNYKSNWDIDNQQIWGKAFNDALQISKKIPNDSVSFISSVKTRYVEVKDFNERKLEFKLIN